MTMLNTKLHYSSFLLIVFLLLSVEPGSAGSNAPVAVAGDDQSVAAGATVYLDGSASYDDDNETLTYSWALQQVPTDSTAQLSDNASVTTSFTTDLIGTYKVTLTVNDGFGDSTPSLATITATDQTAPTNTTSSDFINGGKTTTISGMVKLNLSASDENEIAGYYTSESSTTPAASAEGWVSTFPLNPDYTAQVTFYLSDGLGSKNVSVWFKDLAGNISQPVTDSIEVVDPAYSLFGSHTPTPLLDFSPVSTIGVGWVRLSGFTGLNWNIIESAGDGQYDWSVFDAVLNDLAGEDMQIFVTIRSLNNSDAATCRDPDNPDNQEEPYDSKYPCDIEAFKAFVAEAVARYGSHIIYQLNNEISDTNYWNDTPQNYALLLKETYTTIKQNCPSCTVATAGAVRTDFDDTTFWSTIFSEINTFAECTDSGCFDIFDLHDVIEGGRHISLTDSAITGAQDLMSQYGLTKPIWSTEFGDLSGTLEENAGFLAKSYVANFERGLETLFWRATEECCKLFDDSSQPTVTYSAYQTVINTMGTPSSVEELQPWQYKITRQDSSLVYAAWCENGSCPLDQSILDLGTVTVTSYDGSQETIEASAITLSMTSAIFIESADNSTSTVVNPAIHLLLLDE